jgi:hypothetical protein
MVSDQKTGLSFLMVSSPPLVKWYISALQQEDERGSLVAEKRRYATPMHTTTYELQQHNASRIDRQTNRERTYHKKRTMR